MKSGLDAMPLFLLDDLLRHLFYIDSMTKVEMAKDIQFMKLYLTDQPVHKLPIHKAVSIEFAPTKC